MSSEIVRLNIGCGSNPLEEYINIDFDTIEEMRIRYPFKKFSSSIIIKNYDIFNLPYKNDSVDEILCESLIEHISFDKEEKLFNEFKRVLKPGAKIYLSTPDFEVTATQWLQAKDDWQDFFKNDDESIKQNHWFGTYSYGAENRWGRLAATIFGSQNGKGQFHHNCYTEQKLKKIFEKINLKVISVKKFKWKGSRDDMIGISAIKQ
tara:strand:+ start:6738 stop:7355 length:618 start_codon:yes stop_codon:yes gene_type:complete